MIRRNPPTRMMRQLVMRQRQNWNVCAKVQNARHEKSAANGATRRAATSRSPSTRTTRGRCRPSGATYWATSTPARPEPGCPRALPHWRRGMTSPDRRARGTAQHQIGHQGPGRHGPWLFFQQVPEDRVAKKPRPPRCPCGSRTEGAGADGGAGGRVRLAGHAGSDPGTPRRAAALMSAGFIVMTDPEGNEFCLD